MDGWLSRAFGLHTLGRRAELDGRTTILAMPPLWPILRSRALAATPGTAGTVSALSSLSGLLPLASSLGWIASRAGLTATMLVTTAVALLALLTVARSLATRRA